MYALYVYIYIYKYIYIYIYTYIIYKLRENTYNENRKTVK